MRRLQIMATLTSGARRPLLSVLIVSLLIAVAMLTAVVLMQGGSAEPAAAASGGEPEMALNVPKGTCDDPVRPTTCSIPPGSTFTLSIDALGIPANGYVGVLAFIDFGSKLSYNPAANAADEVVWPDADPVTALSSLTGSKIGIGALTGLVPPLLVSSYIGSLFEFQMACPGTASSQTTIDLLAFDPEVVNGGTKFFEPGTKIQDVPKLSPLTINCVGTPKLPYPGDTDGDGCADERESLPKSQAANGGGRDYLNPWDWYDVNKDGVIDLLNDILGVILHYSPQGGPPYDVVFDRGPVPPGANPWQMTAPDGVIDLLNDILGVLRQHTGFGPGFGCT